MGQTPEKVCLSALEELSRERATPSLRIQARSFSSLSLGRIQWCEHVFFSSVPAKLENCSPGWMELLFCSLRLSPSGWTMHPGIGLEPKGCVGSWDREGPQPLSSSLSSQVREAAQAFNPGLLCVACGSYRRGKATCGDVDVLLTHPDGRSHQGIFTCLLDSLRQQGISPTPR